MLDPVAQCARPMPTAPARPMCTARVAHGHSAGWARCTASRRGRRWRYSGGGGANGGVRAPTVKRLPTGHGGGNDSSPKLLVDGRGRKTGSAATFSDEARAPVASSGPATGRRERISTNGRREKRGGAGRTHRCRRRRRRARTRAGDDGFGPGPDRGARTAVGVSLGHRRSGRARAR
jgi:hypothetical protein